MALRELSLIALSKFKQVCNIRRPNCVLVIGLSVFTLCPFLFALVRLCTFEILSVYTLDQHNELSVGSGRRLGKFCRDVRVEHA